MSTRLLFWILMLIWLVFGIWAVWPNWHGAGGNILLFALLAVLGWRTFGAPIRNE